MCGGLGVVRISFQEIIPRIPLQGEKRNYWDHKFAIPSRILQHDFIITTAKTMMLISSPQISNVKTQTTLSSGFQRTSKKARRRVAFAEYHTIRTTIHIDDYSDEEVLAAWYDKKELQRIKTSIKAFLMRESHNDDDADNDEVDSMQSDEPCSRGLEGFTVFGSAQKKKSKADAAMSVFSEQKAQLNYGVVNEDVIAVLYARFARKCQAVAHCRALQDEMEVLGWNPPPAPTPLSSPIPKIKLFSPSIAIVGQENGRLVSSRAA
jgi:hypothetical protein